MPIKKCLEDYRSCSGIPRKEILQNLYAETAGLHLSVARESSCDRKVPRLFSPKSGTVSCVPSMTYIEKDKTSNFST